MTAWFTTGMYHETTRTDLNHHLGFAPDFSIAAAVMLGTSMVPQAVERFRAILGRVITVAEPFLLFAEHNGKSVGIGITYGATMNADAARFMQILGAQKIVQIGYFGGLQHSMARADYNIVSEAIRHDGASDSYLPKGVTLPATPELTALLAARLADHPIHHLPQLSIVGGILSETVEQIALWSKLGYGGVDLETATTFAIARRFGMQHAAVLLCSDVVVAGDSLLRRIAEPDLRATYELRRELMFQTALDVACAC